MADLTVIGTPVVQGTPDSVTLRIEYPPRYSDAAGRAAIAAYVGNWTAANGWRAQGATTPLVIPGASAGQPVPTCTLTECVTVGGIPRARSWTAQIYDNSGPGGAVGTAGTFDYSLPQAPVDVIDSAELQAAIADVPDAVQAANTAAQGATSAAQAAEAAAASVDTAVSEAQGAAQAAETAAQSAEAAAQGANTAAGAANAAATSANTAAQGANDAAAAANAAAAGVLPERLTADGAVATDWDTATSDGWYVGTNAANGPAGVTVLLLGEVWGADANTLVQTVTDPAGASASDARTWRRVRAGGVWGAWQRARLLEGELDARYAALGHAHPELETPLDYGYLAWSAPFGTTQALLSLVSGTLYLTRCTAYAALAAGQTVTLVYSVTNAGAGVADAYLALYQEAGGTLTRIALSANLSTAWQTAGDKTTTVTLSAPVAAGGRLWISTSLSAATTAPQLRSAIAIWLPAPPTGYVGPRLTRTGITSTPPSSQAISGLTTDGTLPAPFVYVRA